MSIITNRTHQLKLYGAVLALAALMIAVLAVTMTGGAQAQDADNTYADPQPCGPSAGDAFMEEPHELTAGNFYLFDAYWEWLPAQNEDTSGQDTEEEVNAGFLHNNECPPWFKTTRVTDGRGNTTTETTPLTGDNIDIDEVIIHVQDDKKAAVVSGAADETVEGAQISLAEYPDLVPFVDAGDQVWWLQLDDPDTEADETSDLTVGFSTRQFNSAYWYKEDELENAEPPLRYRLAAEYHPTRPYDHPHFLAYRAPQQDDAEGEIVWSSAQAGISLMQMEPGVEVENLQWIFTKAGTYEVWVELDGYVRQNAPDGAADWKPISENVTESSVARRYVFQVGTPLDENEPPVFGVSLTATEGASADTLVGDPIPIFEGEADEFFYTLSGDGAEDFALEPLTDPHAVQVKVAEGVELDYETRYDGYELTLSVTDRIDHESNPDPNIDDTLAVRISVADVSSLSIHVSNHDPLYADTVTFTAVNDDFGLPGEVTYHFTDRLGLPMATSPDGRSVTRQYIGPFTETVHLYATWVPEGGDPATDTRRIDAEPVTVTWRE